MLLVQSPKELVKGQEDLEITRRVKTIQTTTLLGSARILRRVLETWGENSKSIFKFLKNFCYNYTLKISIIVSNFTKKKSRSFEVPSVSFHEQQPRKCNRRRKLRAPFWGQLWKAVSHQTRSCVDETTEQAH